MVALLRGDGVEFHQLVEDFQALTVMFVSADMLMLDA
jgi:hypothetical protein